MTGEVQNTESLIEEFLAALRGGEAVDLETFAAAHPANADELRELLPVLIELEQHGLYARESARNEPSDPPDLTGSDYRLEREIGRGGMGSVWEATQLSLNRKVAVKIMKAPDRGESAWRERFAKESRIVAQLHHPNIVKVFGAGTSGRLCYYAMELVDGTSLDRHPFRDLRAKVRTVLKAAQALAYAHRCGIVHRDIKPANLMLDSSGDIHIADFGLATALAEDGGNDGQQNGTLRYMAPERLLDGSCTTAADQYALGVTLMELITGEPLFRGIAGTALVRKIRNESIPPLKGVDADLAAIVAKSTARRPEDRYRDMEAFAEDLRAWLDGQCVAAARPSAIHRISLWARRKPAMAGLSAAAILCALAFVAALAVGFARTSAALGLAARNASLADAALDDVFHYVERASASRRGAELLSALLPYYGRLAGEKGLDGEKSARVNEILGVCAFRCGDYALAERAFRRLIETHPSAKALNRLSETLRRLGRTDEANTLSRQVAERYVGSADANDRYEAALALETIGRRSSRSAERARAFAIASKLRGSDPANPDFRFLHARLLAQHPRLAKSAAGAESAENAYELLSDLAADYPDRPEYSTALVSAMERRLRSAQKPESIDRKDVELALDTADSLIGRYPNVPDIVSAVISFRDSYSNYLRKIGNPKKANRESVRTTGMLELLSHSAESPDATRLRYSGKDFSVPYRQIVTGSMTEDGEPATLILALHDRSRNGDDNVRQTTAPFLRTLVSYAETAPGQTIIILPQCPAARANQWLGAAKNGRDGLLPTIAELVHVKATEFGAPPGHVLAVGVESGGDACRALMAEHPDVFTRALVAGTKASDSHAQTARETAGEIRSVATNGGSFDRKSLDWLLGND